MPVKPLQVWPREAATAQYDCSEGAPQAMFRDADKQENHINLDIIHQQMYLVTRKIEPFPHQEAEETQRALARAKKSCLSHCHGKTERWYQGSKVETISRH